jgi:hypothetical protein
VQKALIRPPDDCLHLDDLFDLILIQLGKIFNMIVFEEDFGFSQGITIHSKAKEENLTIFLNRGSKHQLGASAANYK